MSKVSICNVVVLNNPAKFEDPFKFEVTFECFETINDDLEFKLIYVGSAESDSFDQELDSVLVGPTLPEGRHMFVFEADAPNPARIPLAETVGVTVVLLSCSYRNQEFIKIGYFILNEYTDPDLKENPPAEPKFSMLTRVIDVQHPRVTKIPIKWDENSEIVEEHPADPPLTDANVQLAGVTQNGDVSMKDVVTPNGHSAEIGNTNASNEEKNNPPPVVET